jgi:hypothetical protein
MKQTMQGRHLFEYAIIRVVPRVEREEFLNIGVIMYCVGEQFLKTKFTLNKERLLSFSADIETEEIEKRLKAIEHICNGDIEGGAIASLPLASRFRWLTAAKSTIVQTSPVHPGLCNNAEEELEKLFSELVS